MDSLAIADLKGIVAPVNFTQPMAEKPYSYNYDPPPGVPPRNTREENHQVKILDGRAVNDRRGEAASLGNLGILARRVGDLSTARRLCLAITIQAVPRQRMLSCLLRDPCQQGANLAAGRIINREGDLSRLGEFIVHPRLLCRLGALLWKRFEFNPWNEYADREKGCHGDPHLQPPRRDYRRLTFSWSQGMICPENSTSPPFLRLTGF